MLLKGQLVTPSVGVVMLTEYHFRRTCLLVPAPELLQIATRRLRQAVNEIIAGHRLPIESLKIQ